MHALPDQRAIELSIRSQVDVKVRLSPPNIVARARTGADSLIFPGNEFAASPGWSTWRASRNNIAVVKALRTLIVGGDSAIGSKLRSRLLEAGRPGVATSRRTRPAFDATTLDLAADPASWSLPRDIGAAIICVAITGEAACRDDPDLARRVNVTNTVALAHELAESGTRVVFLSTDLVSGEPPHTVAAPGNLYAALKAEAENGVAVCRGAVIVRLGKVLTPNQPLISRWVSDLRARRPIEAFDDRWLSPITLDTAADAIIAVAAGQDVGVVYATGRGVVDYYTFACALARAAGAPTDARACRLGAGARDGHRGSSGGGRRAPHGQPRASRGCGNAGPSVSVRLGRAPTACGRGSGMRQREALAGPDETVGRGPAGTPASGSRLRANAADPSCSTVLSLARPEWIDLLVESCKWANLKRLALIGRRRAPCGGFMITHAGLSPLPAERPSSVAQTL